MDVHDYYPQMRQALFLFLVFSIALTVRIAPSSLRIFVGRFGRRHRIAGVIHGLLLLFTLTQTSVQVLWSDSSKRKWVLIDLVLGLSGLILTLTAAYDFKKAHANAKNVASGTLDEHAIVTFSEMIEHAFYQLLNLLQIISLHTLRLVSSRIERAALLILVSSAWLVRHRFPVNKFSTNYSKQGGSSSLIIRHMYRIKKYQYLLYKHALLHGLNLTVFTNAPRLDNLALSTTFRLYWFGLNSSYVMEFFLQTLVRRKFMSQNFLLFLQGILMAASTLAAIPILFQVHPGLIIVSLTLNFINRHHDFANTLALAALSSIYSSYLTVE